MIGMYYNIITSMYNYVGHDNMDYLILCVENIKYLGLWYFVVCTSK